MTAKEKLESVKIYGRNLSDFLLPDQIAFIEKAMEEYAQQKLNIASVVRGCQCETRIGETNVWCCNQCGLPCEDGWLPTNYALGSRTVADGAVGKGVSGGWYCKVFNEDGMMTDDEKCKSQCEKCAQH
jgi:hypothetical protein